ncbi:MAG: helix-turn-helix domain-containing protein [Victivallales bacterium]|nr:helix-turn-helix domain-containing protein [Victivallales bacterium]
MDIREQFQNRTEAGGRPLYFKPLYWSHWKSSQEDIHPHKHPYWQLEFLLDGELQVQIEERNYWLRSGDAMLIPPMRRHTFVYLAERARESWSLKFDFDGFAEGLTERHLHPESTLAYECIKACLRSLPLLDKDFATEIPLLDALVKVLILTLYPRTDIQPPPSPLLRRLYHLIKTLPFTELKVRRLARECGYSADHLSVLVKAATGISIKAFIMREVQAKAERLLLHSHDTIGEISERLGFPDQYAFSHFFHKNAGVSPTTYRNHLGNSYIPKEYY